MSNSELAYAEADAPADTSDVEGFGAQTRVLLDAEQIRHEAATGFLNSFSSELAEPMLDVLEKHRASLEAAIDVVLDDDDLRYSLACRYVELKAHWIQLNFRIQYSNMIHGEAPRVLVAEASVYSFLLGRIEPLIDPAHLRKINEVLLQPIGG